ncbi:MAG: hypothetical protein A2020_08340 [Lentisphaerae bacterium GWF2_45_14]|nr:MAG: hypothetical protein A2020_08340 [Lentisphaerae bacterium GWF2_45_14]
MKNKAVIAFGCHNDDIEARCGGALAEFADQGASTYYVLMNDVQQPAAAEILGAEAIALGYKGFWSPLEYGDPLYIRENSEKLKNDIQKLIIDKKATLVLTHDIDDHHPDHYTMSKCVYLAVMELVVKNSFDGEIWFWERGGCAGNFMYKPDIGIDVSRQMERKNEALKQHVRQLQKAPVLLQQLWKRGRRWGNIFGVEFAEVFKVLTAKEIMDRETLHLDDTEWEDPASFEKRFGIPSPDVSWLTEE